MIARDLIDEARDYHPTFDDRLVQDRMLLRQLTAAQRSLVREVTGFNAEAFAVEACLDKAQIEGALGDGHVQFPPHILILDAAIKAKTGRVYPIDIIPYPARHYPDCSPAVWLRGQSMQLSDGRENYGVTRHGWEEIEELLVQVVLDPANVGTVGATLSLPDSCRDALVGHLVGFMAGRAGVDSAAIERATSHWPSTVSMLAAQPSTASRYVIPRY